MGQVVTTIVPLVPSLASEYTKIVVLPYNEPCASCGATPVAAIYTAVTIADERLRLARLRAGNVDFIATAVLCAACDDSILHRNFERLKSIIEHSADLAKRAEQADAITLWRVFTAMKRHAAMPRNDDDFRMRSMTDIIGLGIPGSRDDGVPNDSHAWISAQTPVPLDQAQAFRTAYRSIYGYAIPSIEALETIEETATSGAIDFGAGPAYWSYLLAQRGKINVVAIDRQPPDVPGNEWFESGRRAWLDVRTGDESALRKFRKGEALLLIYPPPGYVPSGSMALHALYQFPGQTLILVGTPTEATGSKSFHDILNKQWTLRKVVTLPNFFLNEDALYVFERR